MDFEQEPPHDIILAYAGKLFPHQQLTTFGATDRIFPTRTISRGNAPIRPIPVAPRPIEDARVRANGAEQDLIDYVSRNRIVGLLIAKDGETLFERYEIGLTPTTRWMSMSMAKSVATTLVGCAIADGHIGTVDDPLTDYLPILAGSYDGVSIRHLMQMTSGVEWDDTHTNAGSHRRKMLQMQVDQHAGAILEYMASLPRVAEPGTRWNYSTGETHLVGALVKAATGKWLADYLSEKIWSQIGAEQDAAWWLEAPDGLEVAGSGICATLRDYTRFGLFAMDGGSIDGRRVVPESWFAEATTPRDAGGEPLNYGYMWWPVPDRDGGHADRAFSARGIFGQYIYVNPARRILVTTLSARAKPKGAEAIPDNDFFNSVVEALG